MDSLHAAGEIQSTVAVFVNPGRPSDSLDDPDLAQRQRSLEYDSMTPDYGRFLINEVLPSQARHPTNRRSFVTHQLTVAARHPWCCDYSDARMSLSVLEGRMAFDVKSGSG